MGSRAKLSTECRIKSNDVSKKPRSSSSGVKRASAKRQHTNVGSEPVGQSGETNAGIHGESKGELLQNTETGATALGLGCVLLDSSSGHLMGFGEEGSEGTKADCEPDSSSRNSSQCSGTPGVQGIPGAETQELELSTPKWDDAAFEKMKPGTELEIKTQKDLNEVITQLTRIISKWVIFEKTQPVEGYNANPIVMQTALQLRPNLCTYLHMLEGFSHNPTFAQQQSMIVIDQWVKTGHKIANAFMEILGGVK